MDLNRILRKLKPSIWATGPRLCSFKSDRAGNKPRRPLCGLETVPSNLGGHMVKKDGVWEKLPRWSVKYCYLLSTWWLFGERLLGIRALLSTDSSWKHRLTKQVLFRSVHWVVHKWSQDNVFFLFQSSQSLNRFTPRNRHFCWSNKYLYRELAQFNLIKL
jgi:hypothetical protein